MKFISLAAALAFGFSAFAQEATPSTEAQTKMKIEETKEKNKVDGDVDQEITNAKLRAESGSKSKWSGSTTIIYSGSSLETPFADERPNTSQEATAPPTSMGGNISIRYRVNKNNSITVGTGFGLDKPFSQGAGNVSNPYVAYNYVGKIGGVQNIASADLSATTDRTDLASGKQGGTSVSNIMMYDFNGSRWTLGLIISAEYNLYGAGNRAAQRDYEFGAAVPVEYALNDTVQFRTVFRPWYANHSRNREALTFGTRRWTQSAGVAVAIARDINVYPNFQWDVEQWRGNSYNFFSKAVRTNSTIGVQASINVF